MSEKKDKQLIILIAITIISILVDLKYPDYPETSNINIAKMTNSPSREVKSSELGELVRANFSSIFADCWPKRRFHSADLRKL